jgi:ATP-binding cassette subfamily C (CFTR/MRP) protein 4
MCLARAILRNVKIIVLDEATANIDLETDNFIQKKLKEHFKKNTVMIVAHRLATVIDADRILLLEDGKVVEFDHPFKLLTKSETDTTITREDGYLAKMLMATGEETA